MNAIIAPDFAVLAAYVGGLRLRAAAAEDVAKRRCARRLARVLDKIRSGEAVIVSGETIIRDVPREIPGVVPDAWYHLRPDGSAAYIREYRGKRDTPPALE